MIVGDISKFAIESVITQAYQRLSWRGLGYFRIHICGRGYGIQETDATMLANAFDGVEELIIKRGNSIASFSTEDAGAIANAHTSSIYSPDPIDTYFGIARQEFVSAIHKCDWPSTDEAFDDNSRVLHFDISDQVRLIGFKVLKTYLFDPLTLSDLWLPADLFYGTLIDWHDAFENEWKNSTKSPE